MLRCRFCPPYLCRRGPSNSSLAVYWSQYCWEYALEAIMYDEISQCIHKVIKLSLYKHLMCIIEYVIRLWNYTFMLFVLCPWSLRLCWTHNLDQCESRLDDSVPLVMGMEMPFRLTQI